MPDTSTTATEPMLREGFPNCCVLKQPPSASPAGKIFLWLTLLIGCVVLLRPSPRIQGGDARRLTAWVPAISVGHRQQTVQPLPAQSEVSSAPPKHPEFQVAIPPRRRAFFSTAVAVVAPQAMWAEKAVAKVAPPLQSTGVQPINPISDSGIFERIQHFKDVGIPATTTNPLAQACISMATCMLFDRYPSGLFNPARASKVSLVVEAMKKLPSSTMPSNMVLTAKSTMPEACSAADAGSNDLRGFGFSELSGTLDNWQRALCAGPEEPSWGGNYDPAYQPQQQALTLGLQLRM